MSTADLVTGLAPRAEWQADLDRLARTASGYAVLMCDVVGLKAVNEAAGFSAGDARLRAAADRFRDHARGATLTGRLGGDELIAIFTGADAAAAAARAADALAGPGDPPLRSASLVAPRGEAPGGVIDRLYAMLRAS